jgi:hypothetical protein
MTISPERLAEIERILREAAWRSLVRRLGRRLSRFVEPPSGVLLGPEPGHVQLFTDDGEMIFETRPPRWPAAKFVVMVTLTPSRSSVTAGPRRVKGFDGTPVVYSTRRRRRSRRPG